MEQLYVMHVTHFHVKYMAYVCLIGRIFVSGIYGNNMWRSRCCSWVCFGIKIQKCWDMLHESSVIYIGHVVDILVHHVSAI